MIQKNWQEMIKPSKLAVETGDTQVEQFAVHGVGRPPTCERSRRRDPRAAARPQRAAIPAGAHAIQGFAARFVAELRGSYSGVMGLPLFETGELLDKLQGARRI